MRTVLFLAFALFPALSFAQALPGGVYKDESHIAGMSSYAPHHKDRFEVHVVCLVPVINKNGMTEEQMRVMGKYLITDSQWPGLKKNVLKFCKQQNLQVAEVMTEGTPIKIRLEEIPPPLNKEDVVRPKKR